MASASFWASLALVTSTANPINAELSLLSAQSASARGLSHVKHIVDSLAVSVYASSDAAWKASLSDVFSFSLSPLAGNDSLAVRQRCFEIIGCMD